MKKERADGELNTLIAHAGDLLARAEKGVLCSSPFLSMRQAAELCAAFPGDIGRPAGARAVFYGGYAGAERCMLFFLPEYLTAMLSDVPGRVGFAEWRELLAAEWDEAVGVLSVRGSGYRVLDHRDYLGSLLSLGIEREVIGDIVVTDEHTALVFCARKMVNYLLGEWKTVGADTVKVTETMVPEDFCVEHRFLEIHDTIASERLDCMVAALTNLSREKAQGLIRAGYVEADHMPEERVDRAIPPGTVLSIRTFGRYEIVGLDGQTKKGRWRLSARKFV